MLNRRVKFTTVSALAIASLAAHAPLGAQSQAKALSSGQCAVEDGPIRIEDLKLGKHWFGPKITHDDLIGKVVLIEYWGS